MAILTGDCPRCDAQHMTFDVTGDITTGTDYGWRIWLEIFCVCRKCHRGTIFVVCQKDPNSAGYIKKGLTLLEGSLNDIVEIDGFINVKDMAASEPPEHLPKNIEKVFREGSTCLTVGCFNAAGTMFRLCIDLATKTLLPVAETPGLNAQIRRNLGLRLPWLFDNKVLPEALRELSTCIKDDGNDGAHDGTLGKEDAQDIMDFTFMLLERLYAEPKRVAIAKERRESRREGKK